MAIGSIRSKLVAFCIRKLLRGTKKKIHGKQLLAVLNGIVRIYLDNGSRLDLGPGNIVYVDVEAVVEAPYDDTDMLLLSCRDPLHRRLLLTDYALRCNNMLIYDASPPIVVNSYSMIAPLLAPVAIGGNGEPAIIVRPGELVECRGKCIVKPLERSSRVLVVVEE
ncbi:MAG TPA: hypothetical protein EYH59_00925 [Pyrodictium sp.]|nr:hypothetical protein [Pyrodictium sp.]